MESTIQGQVLGVTGKKSKNGLHDMYDVAFSDGNTYRTFDANIAAQANGTLGQVVSAKVSVEQNGRYTNFNLIDIGANLAQPAALAVGAPVSVPNATGVPVPVTVQSAGSGGSGGQEFAYRMHPDVEARITKLSVFDAALGFVGSLLSGAGPEAFEEGKTLALDLAHELYDIAFPPESTVTGPATPPEVAAQVNEVLGAPAVAVGAGTPRW